MYGDDVAYGDDVVYVAPLHPLTSASILPSLPTPILTLTPFATAIALHQWQASQDSCLAIVENQGVHTLMRVLVPDVKVGCEGDEVVKGEMRVVT